VKENVAAGGFMAYGASVPDLFRRAAGYMHRIPARSQARRPAGGAADEVRSRHQPEDRACARARPAAAAEDVANELRDRGALDEEECFIDATFVMAKGGGAEIGATKRGKEKGMKIAIP
jgi:hypothetical protein